MLKIEVLVPGIVFFFFFNLSGLQTPKKVFAQLLKLTCILWFQFNTGSGKRRPRFKKFRTARTDLLIPASVADPDPGSGIRDPGLGAF